MKKSLLTILLFLPLFQYAQVDVFGGGAITMGIKSNHVSYSGFYGRTLNNGNSPGAILPNQDLELITDQGSALNIDFHYYKFDDSHFTVYDMSGMVYFLSYFGNMGSNHSGETGYALANWATTPSENLLKVPNPVDFTKYSRFWNFDLLSIKASFGRKNINGGFNMVFKEMGVTGPFTYFVDKNNQYVYHNLTNVHSLRILIGPNIAFRKTIGMFSVVSMAGVNFSANREDFHIKYNPFFSTVLFFGKGLGGTLGFKYEVVKGYSERQYTGDEILINPVSLNQFEIKLGLNLTGTKK
ncbi:MAG TPA: hypothetical protein PK281_06100 [Flavobacteriales bacterium]|nr:hypothetical protein [Flavobacteriales bacterium]